MFRPIGTGSYINSGSKYLSEGDVMCLRQVACGLNNDQLKIFFGDFTSEVNCIYDE